ncbi:U-scoloptoxin(18)-Er1a-like, partial [Ixodes scapularis]|uniref:U-scoloptoxin(18)-Er1a-like n=1 Tax=Ixodes scapularis TaxID=6945 RepID=UPI001A9CD6DD
KGSCAARNGTKDQKPVLPFPHPTSSPGGVGEACGNYRKCQSGLCCLQTHNYDGAWATCQPKGRPGQQCSEDQVKGGTYTAHCPCLTGPCPAIPNNRCLYLPNN